MGLPVPLVARPSETEADLSRSLREKDEEIRRLKLSKRELEKMVCANTIRERSRANQSTSFADSVRMDFGFETEEEQRNRMPPPPIPLSRDVTQHSRAWHEFREPAKHSLSGLSDHFETSSVKRFVKSKSGEPMTRMQVGPSDS